MGDSSQLTLLALLCALEFASALSNGLALRPPMGFNSYMAPQSGEAGLGAIGDFLVRSGLRESGYTFVNTDEGWESRTRDAQGRLQWSASAFPSGLPAFIDRLHKQKLQFGIYGAASGVTCGQDPGQLFHEDVDAETYAKWGVDFLKSDNCASYALDSSVRFGAMRDALNRTGRPILFSTEPFSIHPDREQSVLVSNIWRVACDTAADVDTFLDRADISDKWAPLAGPGGWNDPCVAGS
jgi:alpha-galactosidase